MFRIRLCIGSRFSRRVSGPVHSDSWRCSASTHSMPAIQPLCRAGGRDAGNAAPRLPQARRRSREKAKSAAPRPPLIGVAARGKDCFSNGCDACPLIWGSRESDPLNLVAEYRRRAAELERLAVGATSIAYCDEILSMAKAWHHLADSRQKMLEGKGNSPAVRADAGNVPSPAFRFTG